VVAVVASAESIASVYDASTIAAVMSLAYVVD